MSTKKKTRPGKGKRPHPFFIMRKSFDTRPRNPPNSGPCPQEPCLAASTVREFFTLHGKFPKTPPRVRLRGLEPGLRGRYWECVADWASIRSRLKKALKTITAYIAKKVSVFIIVHNKQTLTISSVVISTWFVLEFWSIFSTCSLS